MACLPTSRCSCLRRLAPCWRADTRKARRRQQSSRAGRPNGRRTNAGTGQSLFTASSLASAATRPPIPPLQFISPLHLPAQFSVIRSGATLIRPSRVHCYSPTITSSSLRLACLPDSLGPCCGCFRLLSLHERFSSHVIPMVVVECVIAGVLIILVYLLWEWACKEAWYRFAPFEYFNW